MPELVFELFLFSSTLHMRNNDETGEKGLKGCGENDTDIKD